MDSWTSEQFQASSTLKDTRIEIKNNQPEDASQFKKRADELKPPYYPPVDSETIQWEVRHQDARQKVRKDQSYQFVMMVSAFANLKMERLWTTPSEEPKQSSGRATETGDSFNELGTMTDMFSKEQLFQHKWTTTPEVSGLMYLSPMMYGHVQEAFDIIRRINPTLASNPNTLMESNKYRTLYARLVAIRIKMTSFLSGVNYQLDRNWQRLHKEQNMILRHFKQRYKNNRNKLIDI